MKKILIAILVFYFSITNSFSNTSDGFSLLLKNPQLDLTDIYVFKSATPGKTVFIMDFNPQSIIDSPDNFSSQGIYRFCIGADSQFKNGISPTFTFKNNEVQFYMAMQAEPKINETGTFIGQGPINKELEFSNGIKIWTGTIYDLYVGNTPGFANFQENAKKGIYDL